MEKKTLPSVAILVIAILISHSAIAWDTISHDGWNFRISLPHGYKDHNHEVVKLTDGYPVRFGNKAEKFDVRPGDCAISTSGHWSDCENDRERTEMTSIDDLQYHSGDEYWYRWSIFFPNSHKILWPAKVSYAEFKPIGCRPIYQVLESKIGFISKGELSLYLSRHDLYSDAKQFQILTDNYIGKWTDFVAHVKWSHSKNGLFKVWVNGKQKVDYIGKTMRCHKGVYFKYGVYRTFVSRGHPKDVESTNTVTFYDGIRMSKSGEGMFDPLSE